MFINSQNMADDSAYIELMKELQENLRLSENEENENKESEEEKNDEFQSEDFELVTGYRDGSKLLWIPSENCFYKQNTYSKKYDGMAYTCYESECKARKVINNEKNLITIAATHIPHLSMQKMYKELHYLNLMKSMCQTAPHSDSNNDIFERVQAM